MLRSSSLIAGLLYSLIILGPAAQGQAPPPPPGGGGSTGGGYTPGGGGGSGNSGSMVGNSGLRDGVSGGDQPGCCDGFKEVDKASNGGPGMPALWCDSMCAISEAEGGCEGDCDPCGPKGPSGLPSPNGGGCLPCGGGSPATGGGDSTSNYTKHRATRSFVPNNQTTHSSLGPGIFSAYDSKVYFFEDPVAGTTAVVFDAVKTRTYHFVDGLDGDVADGVFHDLRNKAFKSLELKNANDAVVFSLAQADYAELSSWKGLKERFDLLNMSTDPMINEYVARLESATDRNGNTISITYRDSLPSGAGGFTAQELTDSPARRFQIHQITDRVGDVFTYSYKSTQESGRWVAEKIDFPNNTDVDYSYVNGQLDTVTHPNGDTSTYVYGQDAVAQTATVEIKTAGGGPPQVVHLTNDYMTLDANGQAEVINQPQGIFRMAVSDANETLSMVIPDPNQAGVFDVYHGTGSGSNVVVGTSHRFYSDGWTPVLIPQSQTIGITNSGTPEDEYTEVSTATTVEDYYQGTIPGETDETGREFTYDYDTDAFLTRKTFVADSTYEEYAYNSYKQLTRVRDRQGNVTAYEYDANGNMTKQKTGLKEVGGQDVAQPEYAETEWAYYPVGHVNAGLLKTAYDAEWDGSSTDLHRTDYEYNARGLMTKKLESASVSGGDRPETNWTYDANDRVATTTDPGGHQSDDTYNDRGQLIEKEYDDASTEQTLYGALGTPEEGLVVKTKDRRNVVTSYTYDSAGRTTQVTVGTAWDVDILDGNADDTPITDRNEQSITTYVYLDGTELPIEVVRDGSKTEYVYDYRQRVIETKVYPYAGKIMSSKVVYEDNQKFSDEDYYGRKKYYGYRASDGQLIRHVTGAYPSFSLADQTAVFNLVRDTNLNPAYTIKDAITDEDGRPETVIDERGTQFLTEYNAAGQVIRETKAVGTPVEAITEMDYDDDGNVIEIRSPRYFDSTDTNGYQKCKTVMAYDGQGRILTRTEAPGTPEAATESYAYDSEGRQVTRTDARGKIWTTSYASCCGHSVSSKNPLGHGSISNKDNGGLVTHTAGIGDVDTHTTLLDPIDAKTLRETTTRYDAIGRSIAACTWLVPQGVIDPENPPMAGFDGISGQDGLTSQTIYDADLTDGIGLDSTAGVTVTNPLGGTFTVSLSAALTKMAEPIAQGGANTTFNADATGSAIVNLNAENEVSFSISDAQGRTVISGIQHPHDPLPGNTQGDLLTWSCQVHDTTEQLGNGETVLTSINVDALGHTTKARSNAQGHTLETIDQLGFARTVMCDAAGNAIETRDPNQTGFDMVYDDLNRNTSRTDMVGSQTQSVYDKADQQVQAIDAKGKATTYIFDARGNRITEIDRLNYTTNWSYDASGNLLSLTDAENQTTSYTYNDAGQRITEQYPDHIAGAVIGDAGYGIITFSYDSLGQPHTKTDQLGDTDQLSFDLAGRLTLLQNRNQAESPSGVVDDAQAFTFDRNGRLLSATTTRYQNTVLINYDSAGKKISEATTILGNTYVVQTDFDARGEITHYTYPDGTLVSRSYSARGELTDVHQGPNNVLTRTWDAGGRVMSGVFGNGISEQRSYNPDNTLASINYSGAPIGSRTYLWDGNKNKLNETIGGVMAGYGFSVGASDFDHQDRVTEYSRHDGGLTQSWAYTSTGNWSLVTTNSVSQPRSHLLAHELATASNEIVTHDGNGNMTAIPSLLRDGSNTDLHLQWDSNNHLQSASDGSVNVKYLFDALGRRVGRESTSSNASEIVVYVQAGEQTVSDYDGGSPPSSPKFNYVYGGYVDELLVRTESNFADPHYMHQDDRYSVVAVSNSQAAVVERYSYGAFGRLLVHDGVGTVISGSSISNRFTYTGREWDEVLRLYHFRARLYAPEIGRFCGRDPLGFIDSMNLYEASFTAGLKGLDASGMFVNACDLPAENFTIPLPGSFPHITFRGQKKYRNDPDCCEDELSFDWSLMVEAEWDLSKKLLRSLFGWNRWVYKKVYGAVGGRVNVAAGIQGDFLLNVKCCKLQGDPVVCLGVFGSVTLDPFRTRKQTGWLEARGKISGKICVNFKTGALDPRTGVFFSGRASLDFKYFKWNRKFSRKRLL